MDDTDTELGPRPATTPPPGVATTATGEVTRPSPARPTALRRSAAPSRPARAARRPSRWPLPLVAALPFLGGCGPFTRLDYAHLLSRQGWQRTDRVMEALAIEPGAQVADLGAGEGYFSLRFAEAVGPDGRVFAIDVDPKPLAALREERDARGLTQLEVVHADPGDPGLPEGRIDLAFFCNAYHHFADRQAYLQRLHVALRPDARVAIIDGRPHSWFVPKGHWLPPGQLVAELEAAGFRHVTSHDFLAFQTFDVFERVDPASR